MSYRLSIDEFDNAKKYPIAHLPQAAAMLLFCTQPESMESDAQALTAELNAEDRRFQTQIVESASEKDGAGANTGS